LACALVALVAVVSGCGGPASTSTDGKQIFSDAGCAGCHKLDAAGADGSGGPDLNTIGDDATEVANQVREGGGGMPAFSGELTDEQITAVSEFVAANDGSK
jgi:cytochrome c551